MISVVVVDDHAVFREGLRALLARVADISVVGEASTTDEAVAVSADVQPDVVLMDLNLPGGGGEVATRRILATRPETAVLVLTMHADGGHLQQALGAGARGYLLKDAEPAAIVGAITSVHLGQAIFDPGVASHVLAAAAAPGSDRPFPVLTERDVWLIGELQYGPQRRAALRCRSLRPTETLAVCSSSRSVRRRMRTGSVSCSRPPSGMMWSSKSRSTRVYTNRRSLPADCEMRAGSGRDRLHPAPIFAPPPGPAIAGQSAGPWSGPDRPLTGWPWARATRRRAWSWWTRPGPPIRPEAYSNRFAVRCPEAGLRKIDLHATESDAKLSSVITA